MAEGINLLPWKNKREIHAKRQFVLFATSALVLVCSVYGLIFQKAHSEWVHLKKEQNVLQKSVLPLEKKIKNLKNLEEELKQKREQVKDLNHLFVVRNQTVMLLDEIAHNIPDHIYLNHLSRKNTRVIVSGKAESNSQVAQFLRTMEEASSLTEAQLSVIQAEEKDKSKQGSLLDFNVQALQEGMTEWKAPPDPKKRKRRGS